MLYGKNGQITQLAGPTNKREQNDIKALTRFFEILMEIDQAQKTSLQSTDVPFQSTNNSLQYKNIATKPKIKNLVDMDTSP